MGVGAIILLTMAIMFISLTVFIIVASIIEKDYGILPFTIPVVVFAIICFAGAHEVTERTGVVCSVETIQTDYTQEIVDGEIKQVPVYSYLILFIDEDGEYRTITTKDVTRGVLKEGDSIIYTNDSSKEVNK